MKLSLWTTHHADGCRVVPAAPLAEIERDQTPRIGECLRVSSARYRVRDVEHLDDPPVHDERPTVRLYVERVDDVVYP